VLNPDGSTSSVRSMSFGDDSGREVLVPTVTDDGRIASDDEAIQQYAKTGRTLGRFGSPDEADAFAQALHESEARRLTKLSPTQLLFASMARAQKPANFDLGGTVGPDGRIPVAGAPGESQLPSDSSIPTAPNMDPFNYSTPEYASTVNGGLLKTGPYNDTRAASLANSQALLASAAGRGPSVAPQQLRNANDDAIAQAMQAGAGMRGGGRGVGEAAAIGGGATVAQQGAGQAAGVRMQETDAAGRQAANALQQQRAQDLAFAQAQQQAAWRNTMTNSGIGLAQQAGLRSLLGGAGQALAAGADLFGRSGGPDFGGGGDFTGADNSTTGQPTATGGTYDEYGPSGFGGTMAHGGMVPGETKGDDKRAAAFLKALRGRTS
jgi:hypothetical protein